MRGSKKVDLGGRTPFESATSIKSSNSTRYKHNATPSVFDFQYKKAIPTYLNNFFYLN